MEGVEGAGRISGSRRESALSSTDATPCSRHLHFVHGRREGGREGTHCCALDLNFASEQSQRALRAAHLGTRTRPPAASCATSATAVVTPSPLRRPGCSNEP
eukprot:SAG31_NODE_1718_length_7457_cov_3.659418_7_plen_102_part_00